MGAMAKRGRTSEESSRKSVPECPPVIGSFPPVATSDAAVLILGSMPGAASLAARQYYAHPRNAFWPIMEALFAISPALPYQDRLSALAGRRVALWDVMASCVRPGSLDSSIVKTSVTPNDFTAFFRTHQKIHTVFFNGAKAEETWRRFVAPNGELPSLRRVRLPSTSPAHAGKTLEEKIEEWQVVRERALSSFF